MKNGTAAKLGLVLLACSVGLSIWIRHGLWLIVPTVCGVFGYVLRLALHINTYRMCCVFNNEVERRYNETSREINRLSFITKCRIGIDVVALSLVLGFALHGGLISSWTFHLVGALVVLYTCLLMFNASTAAPKIHEDALASGYAKSYIPRNSHGREEI